MQGSHFDQHLVAIPEQTFIPRKLIASNFGRFSSLLADLATLLGAAIAIFFRDRRPDRYLVDRIQHKSPDLPLWFRQVRNGVRKGAERVLQKGNFVTNLALLSSHAEL